VRLESGYGTANVALYGLSDSGQLLLLRTDLSGHLDVDVDVDVGDVIAVISGGITNLSGGQNIGRVTVDSGEIHVVSGEVVSKVSGQWVPVTDLSGHTLEVDSNGLIGVGVHSGEVHVVSGQLIAKVSGETVTQASGAVINRALLSGLQVITQLGIQVSGTVAVSGVVDVSGSHVWISGQHVYVESGTEVTTRKGGEADALFSGYACTNTYIYSGVSFLKYDKMTILLECLEEGSGVSYTIRGEPLSGILTYSLGSGQLTSGEQALETVTDPYEWIEVGAENTVDDRTGVLTVTIARR
jgi:hypothetical protein